MFLVLKQLLMFEGVRKILREVFTSSSGEYDPARLWGYGFCILGGTQYLITSAYVVITTGQFDPVAYATGLAGISTALVAAAAGVWIKRTAEKGEEPKEPPKGE